MITLLTSGTDPEIFLVNEENEGIPSEQYIKGDKNEVTDLTEEVGKGFSILCDNVMVEFNIPPCSNKQDFVESHKKMIKYIQSILPEYIYTDISASKQFSPEKLKSKLAKTFGCSPDFNAWTICQNKAPNAKNSTLRTCGGHIHIGYDKIDFDTSIKLLKLFDYFLGIPSIILDKDTERRKMYGNAGCFRLKEYGFEYRTLSNFWLQSTELMEWVWDQINYVFDFYNANPDFNFEDGDIIVNCINNQDFELAYELIEKYNIKLPNINNTVKLEKIYE